MASAGGMRSGEKKEDAPKAYLVRGPEAALLNAGRVRFARRFRDSTPPIGKSGGAVRASAIAYEDCPSLRVVAPGLGAKSGKSRAAETFAEPTTARRTPSPCSGRS
jgi:hypothetical protein